MAVEQFCTREVVTIHPAATVATAAARMAEENVGTLVVVEGHKPVGIVTDRDLVLRVLAKGQTGDTTEVSAVMTPHPICITTGAPMKEAIMQMKTNHIRRLVVVDAQQDVVGIIALDDIIDMLTEERQALERMRGIMQATVQGPRRV
jgi:CBS domain-containing protein